MPWALGPVAPGPEAPGPEAPVPERHAPEAPVPEAPVPDEDMLDVVFYGIASDLVRDFSYDPLRGRLSELAHGGGFSRIRCVAAAQPGESGAICSPRLGREG